MKYQMTISIIIKTGAFYSFYAKKLTFFDVII